MKNVVQLENYYMAEELERAIARFVEYDNNRRYHESLGNVTPIDMYHGRQAAILRRRERLQRETLAKRSRENLQAASPHRRTRCVSSNSGPRFRIQLATHRQVATANLCYACGYDPADCPYFQVSDGAAAFAFRPC